MKNKINLLPNAMHSKYDRSGGKWTYISKWYAIIPMAYMILLYIIPMGLLFATSIVDSNTGDLTFNNYSRFLFDGYYLKILLVSLALGLGSTIICILMGYPVAYRIARMKGNARSWAMACVMLPLWISVVVRMYGWMATLTRSGVVNTALLTLGIITEPITFLGSYSGVMIGLVHCGLPYMITTLVSPIENVDRNLEDASYVFGCGFLRTFFKVTLPLTTPSIISASLLVFALNTAAFVVPVMLGSGKLQVITTLIRQQALYVFDWSFVAAISVILLATSTIIVVISRRISKKNKVITF